MSTPDVNSVFSFICELRRDRTNGGEKKLPVTRAIPGVTQVLMVEQVLAPGATAVQIPQGTIGSAAALVVFATQPIVMHLNGSGAPAVNCGSFTLISDTNISGLWIDNNIASPAAATTVEVWFISTT
jgi:hypothetical protein